MKKGSSIMLWLLKTPHDRRAKDGSVSAAGGLAAMGPVVGRRFAWTQSLAAVVDSPGDGVCTGPEDGHHLATGRGNLRRLRRLLLLSPTPGPQVQSSGRAAVHVAFDSVGQRPTRAVGRGRLADQALWSARPGSRDPSQSHARPRGPEVPVRSYLGHDFAGAAAS